MTRARPITISRVDANFEREPLSQPMGFKGGYVSEAWQTAALLESGSGHRGLGLCTQGVLWSDATVFAGHAESGGNALMYAVTDWAVQRLKGVSFTDPVGLLESIRHEVHAAAKRITGHAGLRETFSLNALVGVDFAAWLLYAAEHRIRDFDSLIPPEYRPALAARHQTVASIPLMSYAVPVEAIRAAVDDGFFFMKIKIGQPGTQAEMLEKDMARLSAIHAAIGHARTPHTADGRLPYYFDANGRYESKEALLRLLEHAEKIGALGQIALVEEPFPEELEIDVGDLPVRVAADESAHTDADAARRIEMGYGAIALKPIAKTLSMSLKIAKLAHEKNV
ncbi:MAG: enolase C-terminal domain-like protein, partial [Planctomycetia bacterium]